MGLGHLENNKNNRKYSKYRERMSDDFFPDANEEIMGPHLSSSEL